MNSKSLYLLIVIVIIIAIISLTGLWYNSIKTSNQNSLGFETIIGKPLTLESFTYNGLQVSLPPGKAVTIQFNNDGRLTGSGVCNNYFGSFEISNNNEISIGPLGATLMACPEGMEEEQQYFAAIEKIDTFKVTIDGLELSSKDGSTVLYFK